MAVYEDYEYIPIPKIPKYNNQFENIYINHEIDVPEILTTFKKVSNGWILNNNDGDIFNMSNENDYYLFHKVPITNDIKSMINVEANKITVEGTSDSASDSGGDGSSDSGTSDRDSEIAIIDATGKTISLKKKMKIMLCKKKNDGTYTNGTYLAKILEIKSNNIKVDFIDSYGFEKGPITININSVDFNKRKIVEFVEPKLIGDIIITLEDNIKLANVYLELYNIYKNSTTIIIDNKIIIEKFRNLLLGFGNIPDNKLSIQHNSAEVYTFLFKLYPLISFIFENEFSKDNNININTKLDRINIDKIFIILNTKANNDNIIGGISSNNDFYNYKMDFLTKTTGLYKLEYKLCKTDTKIYNVEISFQNFIQVKLEPQKKGKNLNKFFFEHEEDLHQWDRCDTEKESMAQEFEDFRVSQNNKDIFVCITNGDGGSGNTSKIVEEYKNINDFIKIDEYIKEEPIIIKNLLGNEVKYSLRGITLHGGGPEYGHFLSIINKNGIWYALNDSTIEKGNFNDIIRYINNKIYFTPEILHYRQVGEEDSQIEVRGIKNVGSSCYLNSLLQVMINCPTFEKHYDRLLNLSQTEIAKEIKDSKPQKISNPFL
jgi:hypothetical protein